MSRQANLTNWILFEDDDFLVINKPPYIASLDDRSSTLNINKLAKAYWPDAQLCHRLDKDTSGVMLLAKHPDAYKFAAILFEQRNIHKVYHAVVHGTHEFTNRLVDAPLLTTGKGKVVVNHRQGKPSSTTFTTLAIYKAYSLVQCEPLTGRMHQIRVHLAGLQAPIVGDTFYGGQPFYLSAIKRNYHLKKNTEEKPLIQRFALHAYELTFTGLHGKPYNFKAPYPKDFSVLLKQLKKACKTAY